MTTALSLLGPEERELVVTAPAPSHADVMKAVLTDDRFDDPEWIYERKLDGIRCLAVRSGERVRLLSRNDLAMNDRYPEVAEGLEQEACSQFAVDGEIVAFDGPETSFSLLTQRAHHYVPVFLYVFDLIWLEGYDLRALPLRSRKRVLRGALEFIGSVRYTQYRNEKGKELFEEACRKGWEDDRQAGRQQVHRQAVARLVEVQVRPRPGTGDRRLHRAAGIADRIRGAAARLLRRRGAAVRRQGGDGLDFDTLRDLGAAMRARQVDTPPFADPASIRERGVTWVKPELVAEIGFSEWTPYGRLRHPRFLGLRDDKAASEVVAIRTVMFMSSYFVAVRALDCSGRAYVPVASLGLRRIALRSEETAPSRIARLGSLWSRIRRARPRRAGRIHHRYRRYVRRIFGSTHRPRRDGHRLTLFPGHHLFTEHADARQLQ